MKKRYLGIICFIYIALILYVKLSGKLGNYLAPQMQNHILLSIVPLFLIGLVLTFNNKINYKFKFVDIILLLPLIMLVFCGDGRLTMNLATNRNTMFNNSVKNNSSKEQVITEDKEGNKKEEDNDSIISEELKPYEPIKEDNNVNNVDEEEYYDFSNIDYDVADASYEMLASNLTYSTNVDYYVGRTIRVRGFTMKIGLQVLPKEYFAIGKYAVSCCAADAGFTGFIAKYDMSKVKHNAWYEVEGVLEKSQDAKGYDILIIKVVNIREIDGSKEEQYVYPCYAYDDGLCSIYDKYDILPPY